MLSEKTSLLWGIKIPKVQGSESFQVVEHIPVLGRLHAKTPWGQNLLSSGLFLISLTYLFMGLFICVLAYSLLNNKPVNISKCFLEFHEPSSKLSNLRKGYWETQFYSWLVRNIGDNLGLVTGV